MGWKAIIAIGVAGVAAFYGVSYLMMRRRQRLHPVTASTVENLKCRARTFDVLLTRSSKTLAYAQGLLEGDSSYSHAALVVRGDDLTPIRQQCVHSAGLGHWGEQADECRGYDVQFPGGQDRSRDPRQRAPHLHGTGGPCGTS